MRPLGPRIGQDDGPFVSYSIARRGKATPFAGVLKYEPIVCGIGGMNVCSSTLVYACLRSHPFHAMGDSLCYGRRVAIATDWRGSTRSWGGQVGIQQWVAYYTNGVGMRGFGALAALWAVATAQNGGRLAVTYGVPCLLWRLNILWWWHALERLFSVIWWRTEHACHATIQSNNGVSEVLKWRCGVSTIDIADVVIIWYESSRSAIVCNRRTCISRCVCLVRFGWVW